MIHFCRFHAGASAVALGLAAGLAVVFFGPTTQLTVVPRAAAAANVLRVACTQPLSLDPQRRGSMHAQANLLQLSLWEPLVECHPVTGEPQSAAARAWTWSADRLRLTIELQPDARWSNGEPVVAADFVRSWTRLLREKKAGAAILFPVRNAQSFERGDLVDPAALGFRAASDHTLVVELDRPRSTFVMELADPLLSPLHPTSEAVLKGRTYFQMPATLITNGPFQLRGATRGGYDLVVSPHYHGRAGVQLAGVSFVLADNLVVAHRMLAAGVVDLLAPTPEGPLRTWPTRRPYRLETELQPTVHSIDFNVNRAPLGDQRVRRALALALDRTTPIEAFDPGHRRPAWSWVPEMPGRPGLRLLEENEAEARRLLAAAGFPGGVGFPVLRMALPSEPRPNRFVLAWTERWFRVLGVRTYVSYERATKHRARMDGGDYDVLYNQLTATVPDAGDLLGTFQWPSDMNGTNWRDPETTALIAEANTQSGPAHLALLDQAERRVMAELPSVPVMFEVRQTLLADEVRGWYADPMARQNVKRLSLAPPSS